jgi:D-alanyl-D-alanine carboxypeptidase (penicillin-binding protein 5/6)
MLLPAGTATTVSGDVVYAGPIKAPIVKGTKLGELIVHVPDLGDQRVDLLAASDVGVAGFATRLSVAVSYLRARYGL